MRKQLLYILSFVSVFGAISCQKNRFRKEDLLDKIIILNIDSMQSANESLSNNYNYNAGYRYVCYIDSVSCSSCEIYKMGMWNKIVGLTKDIGIKYIFIFRPKQNLRERICKEYKYSKQHHTFFIDTLGVLERNNPILSKSVFFHNFLLDKYGRVIYVGNPAKNEKQRREYFAIIDEIRLTHKNEKRN